VTAGRPPKPTDQQRRKHRSRDRPRPSSWRAGESVRWMFGCDGWLVTSAGGICPCRKSPMRRSGRPFLTQSQVTRVWMMAVASKPKACNDFVRRDAATLMRRSEQAASVVNGGVGGLPVGDVRRQAQRSNGEGTEYLEMIGEQCLDGEYCTGGPPLQRPQALGATRWRQTGGRQQVRCGHRDG
jgi:hypothetical protein